MPATMRRPETDPTFTASGATDAEVAAGIAAHNADETEVHGIANTANLASLDDVRAVTGQVHGQNGQYVPTMPGSYVQNGAIIANVLYLGRFVAERSFTVGSMVFNVAAAGGSQVLQLGIYDIAGNRLTTSGSVTPGTDSTGPKIVDVPDLALVRGTPYVCALAVNNPLVGAAPQFAFRFQIAPSLFGTSWATGLECGFQAQPTLPATIVATPSFTTASPAMALKAA